MKVYFGNLPKDIDDAKLGEIVTRNDVAALEAVTAPAPPAAVPRAPAAPVVVPKKK